MFQEELRVKHGFNELHPAIVAELKIYLTTPSLGTDQLIYAAKNVLGNL